MRAVVLVGGFGTRLRPLTLHRPKQMLPLLDRPMIEWVAEHLGRAGVEEIVLALGYRPEAFLEAYPEGTCAGVRMRYAVEPEPLGTAGAIRFAATELGLDRGSEPFLVVNGDVITDLDIGELVDLHRRSGAEGTIALSPVDDPSRYGVVPIDRDGRVQAFIEKPEAASAPSHWINAGTYVLEPALLDRIPAGRAASVERETFPAVVAEGGLFALESDAYWIDAGTPETYLQVQLDLAQRRTGPDASWVDQSATIAPTAHVERAVIGAGVVVADGATVVRSVLGAGSLIGTGSTVHRSVVGPAATVGDGASLHGLSVVGDGVEVPPGTALRSARLPAGE